MNDSGNKNKIIETALKLFNRNGTYAVTTRHIAADMNISPGNLYYHYRNKEEIIRVLLEQMIEEFNLFIRSSEFNTDPALLIKNAISITGKIMYNYRFFFMEITTLLEKDHVLKKKYFRIKQERVSDFKAIRRFLDHGGLFSESLTDDDFYVITENAWTLSEFLLQSMYVKGIKITPENVMKNFSRVLYTFRPYLKKEFRELIN